MTMTNSMSGESLFRSFPDSARVWIYAAAEPIGAVEARFLLDDLNEFVRSWASHGNPVTAELAIVEHRFVMVAGYVAGSTVSGCGIDASVRALDEAASGRGILWASPLDVFFRDDTGVVRRASRSEFRRMARDGVVGLETHVFDPSVCSIADLRRGEFESTAGMKWHRRLVSSAEAMS